MKAREVLDNIAEVLARGGPQSDHLWAVLTALRGPDGPEDVNHKRIKQLTTARIRAVVGVVDFTVGADVRRYPLNPAEREDRHKLLAQDVGQHFARHYYVAVAAIRELYGYDLYEEKPWSTKQS